ncbi:MAG: hypothetical protein HUU50_11160 [Candidatus Brocadiae bacterium]|nr:hypothetical protein [Candidatus Brocadiia bacterium]
MKLQAARGFYLKLSLRVSLLSGIKKTGIPFFLCARLRAYPKNPFGCKLATATLAAILSLSPRSPSASKFSPKIIFRIGSKSRINFFDLPGGTILDSLQKAYTKLGLSLKFHHEKVELCCF